MHTAEICFQVLNADLGKAAEFTFHRGLEGLVSAHVVQSR